MYKHLYRCPYIKKKTLKNFEFGEKWNRTGLHHIRLWFTWVKINWVSVRFRFWLNFGVRFWVWLESVPQQILSSVTLGLFVEVSLLYTIHLIIPITDFLYLVLDASVVEKNSKKKKWERIGNGVITIRENWFWHSALTFTHWRFIFIFFIRNYNNTLLCVRKWMNTNRIEGYYSNFK